MYQKKHIRSAIKNLNDRKKSLERQRKDLLLDAEEVLSCAITEAHIATIKQFIKEINQEEDAKKQDAAPVITPKQQAEEEQVMPKKRSRRRRSRKKTE